MTTRVEPVYGYGWSVPSGESRDVPPPFDLAIDELVASQGIVLNDDHEFSGASVRLFSRHATETGIFNMTISRGGSTIASGFAKVGYCT